MGCPPPPNWGGSTHSGRPLLPPASRHPITRPRADTAQPLGGGEGLFPLLGGSSLKCPPKTFTFERICLLVFPGGKGLLLLWSCVETNTEQLCILWSIRPFPKHGSRAGGWADVAETGKPRSRGRAQPRPGASEDRARDPHRAQRGGQIGTCGVLLPVCGSCPGDDRDWLGLPPGSPGGPVLQGPGLRTPWGAGRWPQVHSKQEACPPQPHSLDGGDRAVSKRGETAP